jgi:hypothetical protein
MLIQEKCPFETPINPDTAYFVSTNNSHGTTLTLSHKCAACMARYRWGQFLASREMAMEPGQEHCQHGACLLPPWQDMRYCKAHSKRGNNSVESLAISPLRKELMVRIVRQWMSDKIFDKVLQRIAEIETGEMPVESLVCLDLEYDVENYYVYEVAICTLLPNEPEVLIDAVTKFGAKPPKFGLRKTRLPPVVEEFATTPQRIRTAYGRNQAIGGRVLQTGQIAEKLRQFMKPDTIILTWATNANDLTALRDFLEANGHEAASVLPSKDNCVFMVPHFRRNLGKLSDGKWFPAKLEILFPLLFPGNGLAARSHSALPDTLMLKLIVFAFLELLTPIKNRGKKWQSLNCVANAQKTIQDYFTPLSDMEHAELDPE